MSPTWGQLLGQAVERFRATGVAVAGVAETDARRIVEETSGRPSAELVLALDEVAPERDVARFDEMLARRLAGEPLQYVLGRWGFRTLDLLVDRRVLIPRPETEQVVEVALGELDRMVGGESTSNRRRTIVDLGCGSGAMGLSLAVERGGIDVWCVDVAPGAVEVTNANRAALGERAAGVTVLEGSWFEPLPCELCGAVDLIVTNPPYVSAADPLPPEVADWEPTVALVAGPTGLEATEQILGQALAWLVPDGRLVMEIGETQGASVRQMARRAGFAGVEVRPDLAGRDRALVARHP